MDNIFEPPLYYNRLAESSATHANLPHWHQRCATFITFRLADSLPQSKLTQFLAERETWLTEHPKPWDDSTQQEYDNQYAENIQKWLDAGYGSCVLKNCDCRKVVESAFRHFDGIRYSLYAYVVMPNHAHVLFMPRDGFSTTEIAHSWKSFTGTTINRMLGKSGSLWQKESFDRLIRNVEEFNATRSYIRANAPALAFDVYNT